MSSTTSPTAEPSGINTTTSGSPLLLAVVKRRGGRLFEELREAVGPMRLRA
jgi:hypothetical protein